MTGSLSGSAASLGAAAFALPSPHITLNSALRLPGQFMLARLGCSPIRT